MWHPAWQNRRGLINIGLVDILYARLVETLMHAIMQVMYSLPDLSLKDPGDQFA